MAASNSNEPPSNALYMVHSIPGLQSTMIEIPVTSITESTTFFARLGFKRTNDIQTKKVKTDSLSRPDDPAFQISSFTWSINNNYTDLILHPMEHFQRYGGRTGKDEWMERTEAVPFKQVSHIVALGCKTRESVDELCDAATQQAGKLDPIPPAHVNDTMYRRYIEDPDGRIWCLYWSRLAHGNKLLIGAHYLSQRQCCVQ